MPEARQIDRPQIDGPTNPPDGGELEMLNSVFSAISDPVRREILTKLEEGDQLVSELAEPFDISLQAISRHIQVLVKAGLITQERTGRISRCSLDSGPLYAAAVWLNRYSKYWQTQFDTLAVWVTELDQVEDETTEPAKTKDAE
jgi:DNA-binding transcriptional ArsR family regulator